MERDRFLARVASGVMAASLPHVPEPSGPLPETGDEDLVGLFRSRAVSVSTVVHGPVSRHGVPRVVAGIASGHRAASFMAWDDIAVTGIPSTLMTAGLSRVDTEVPVGEARRRHLAGYLQVGIGITGAIAGLAESGSIVLHHGPGKPRLASLIPEVHVAVVDVDVIERSLAHWSQHHPGVSETTANLVVITGPSRSGDIELQLNLGVHGPRHLHVVLVG